MDALKEDLAGVEIGASTASFQKYLESQKELFHSQIDHLQRIVVTQCKLTGVNPLSQEMAAGAMSIKIGKRPRDLLNPKAVKYMQAVFSIKDAISKKECREISAQFGVTVTQVRDFFNSQRSRVRKLVWLSSEKAARATARKGAKDDVGTSDSMNAVDPVPLNSVAPGLAASDSIGAFTVPLKTVGSIPVPLNAVDPHVVPLGSVERSSGTINSAGSDPIPLNSVGPSGAEVPSCSMQDNTLSGIDESDKHFVENIFNLLQKEETFSGQVKLMQWILQIQTPSVLNWFLVKGGVSILATWLSIAAAEEQTSFLLIVLKVFCHLPLRNALPEHMSAILQSVNKLRFYRMPDISNRARVLLSKWSKMFAQSQASKRPDGSRSSASAQEMLLKQSIDEIMGDELWQPSISDPGNMPALPFENSENMRKIEPSRAVKLLPPTDDSSRKQILGASASHTRKRRKVLLVDQPGQRAADKSTQAIKSVSNQSRPMSADDIQKAKMRAQYKQRNFGKTSSLNGSNATKTEILHKPASSTSMNLSRSPVTKFPVRPKIEEQKKYSPIPQKLSNKLNDHIDLERKVDPKEPLDDLCKRVQIPWQTPPEVKLNDIWRVGTGESSKEVDVQKNRNKREMEILYDTILDIPSNPREPWDLEMDYDDTLTPEIPVEQQPDVDGSEMQPSNSDQIDAIPTSVPSLPQVSTGIASEPDLELLAALLKNPELVFALTSGQAGNLSSEETVRLLDMIKKGGLGVSTDSNGIGKKVEENVEVSLPSPTPANNPGTSGWRPDFAKNPFSRQSIAPNKVDYTNPGVPTIAAPLERHPSSIVGVPEQQASISLLSQHLPAFVPGALHQTTALTHEKQQTGMMPSSVHPIHSTSSLQASVTEIVTPTRNSPAPNISVLNFPSGIGPSRQREVANMAPSSMGSFTMDASERQQASFPYSPSIATPMQTLTRPSQQQAQRVVELPSVTSSRIPGGNLGPVSDSWSARQGLASNYHHKVKQTNFNVTYREPGRSQMRSGPPSERHQFDGDDGFESWSPENSPGRSPAQMMARRDYSGPSANSRWEHMPGNRQPRPRYPSSHRDQNRDGNRRWR